jgi:hypothetical protein
MKTKKEFNYAATFDKIMSEVFPGEVFTTYFNILAGSTGCYITTRPASRQKRSKSGELQPRGLTKQQALVGRGISLALAEQKP